MKETKYLGMVMDEYQTFKNHMDTVKLKLIRANGSLAKLRHHVNPALLRTIYFAIFEPHLWYGCQLYGWDIETLSIDRELNKEHFLWKNHTENVHQKLALDPFLILLNNPKQPLHTRNSFKIRHFERGLSKSLKKLNLYFLSNPVPFNGQSYQKQKGSGASHQSDHETSSEKFLYLLYIIWPSLMM